MGTIPIQKTYKSVQKKKLALESIELSRFHPIWTDSWIGGFRTDSKDTMKWKIYLTPDLVVHRFLFSNRHRTTDIQIRYDEIRVQKEVFPFIWYNFQSQYYIHIYTQYYTLLIFGKKKFLIQEKLFVKNFLKISSVEAVITKIK